MTDSIVTHYPVSLDWPRACPLSGASANLKSQPEDFVVEEMPLAEPVGQGEHVWLWINKRNANTAWVAARLAEFAGVREMDVGFAGLKDRRAVTSQWFSLYMPRGETPDFRQLDNDEFRILRQERHERKLRRGDLAGNRFTLRLRQLQGNRAAVEENLQQIARNGFPNYFGNQRFGHDAGNIHSGIAMLKREIRVRNPAKKGLYLSAVRSWLFNQVLAERVSQGNWFTCMAGEVADTLTPTGPLWGRGRALVSDEQLLLEDAVLAPLAEVRDALEHSGLNQERRALAVIPGELQWRWEDTADGVDLLLGFTLGAGFYATALLREVLELIEPEVATETVTEADS
jgi:tRNA pseudouridine13 synthase